MLLFIYLFLLVPSDPTQTFALLGDQGTYAPMGFKVADSILTAHKQTPFNMAIHVGIFISMILLLYF